MPNLLGLSIDVNTIGWTLIDGKTKKIKAMGTRVFPHGSDNFGSGAREVSKKTQRTANRVKRLRYSRKRMRKIFLLKILIPKGMCPMKQEELEAFKSKKSFKSKIFDQWISMNPYELRSRATHEQLTLHELGRIYYHMSLRRGFPFGKRNTSMRDNAIYNGIPAFNRPGINDISSNLKDSTLGAHLYTLLPEMNKSYTAFDERVRNRFVSRQMYREEAHAIWNHQEKFHSELEGELREQLIGKENDFSEIQGAVFYQKPLKSQKFRVGKCLFEPKKSKCCVSSLTYQSVLAYKWINTIQVDGKLLSDEDRERIFFFFNTHRKFNFGQVRQMLNLSSSNSNKKDKEVIIGSFINATLSSNDLFGLDWFEFDPKIKQDIWHALYFFNDKDKLQLQAQLKWGLNEVASKRFSSIAIDKRYAPISEKAAKNILFFLKRGIKYDLSVVLAGVKNSLSAFWDNIAESDIQYIINKVIEIYKENVSGGFMPKLQEFLLDEMQFTDFQITKLYGQYAQVIDFSVKKKFPLGAHEDKEINDFKNPLLINSLFQTRKLINSIVEKHGSIDEIKVELNTNLKTNKFQRYMYRLDQNRLAANRRRIIQKIGALSENLTPMNILKLELWEECKGTCPYSGVSIPLDILFTEKTQIIYIHPWSESLNDSNYNKTLCLYETSLKVGENTPFEYFNTHLPQEWDTVVRRASELFSNTKEYPSNTKKFRKFVKRYYHRNHVENQMNDSNFLSREVACFLSKVCVRVSITSGYTTERMIEMLSLNKILDSSIKKYKYIDHRYHALNSYITAIRDLNYLKVLSEINKYEPQKVKTPFPTPRSDFRDEVEYFINSILVSHKKSSRLISKRKVFTKRGGKVIENSSIAVRGSLHKDSVFGKRTPPNLETAYHMRKSLAAINTLSQIDKIVDSRVKSAVLKTLDDAGISESTNFIPKNVFFNISRDGRMEPKVFLPNANGDPVPVKKVRLRETFNAAVQLSENVNQHVNLRKNHHVIIYKNSKNEYSEDVVSFWEAVRRERLKQPIYAIPEEDSEFVTTLAINDLFLLGIHDLNDTLKNESRSFLIRHLYRVQKLSSFFYEFRLAFDNELDTTEAPSYVRINNFGSRKTGWLTYNPTKVSLNIIGEISEAKEPYHLKTKKIIL